MKKAIALTFAIFTLAGCGQPVTGVKLSAAPQILAAKSAKSYAMSSLTVPDSIMAYANDYIQRMASKYSDRSLEFYADVVASQDDFKTQFVSAGNSAGYCPGKAASAFSNKFVLFDEATHMSGKAITSGSYRYYIRVSVSEPYAAHHASFLSEPRFFVSNFGKNFEGTISVGSSDSK